MFSLKLTKSYLRPQLWRTTQKLRISFFFNWILNKKTRAKTNIPFFRYPAGFRLRVIRSAARTALAGVKEDVHETEFRSRRRADLGSFSYPVSSSELRTSSAHQLILGLMFERRRDQLRFPAAQPQHEVQKKTSGRRNSVLRADARQEADRELSVLNSAFSLRSGFV